MLHPEAIQTLEKIVNQLNPDNPNATDISRVYEDFCKVIDNHLVSY